MHEEFFLHLSAFSQQTLHGSSGSAPVAVETQIWVQMQWQRRWSIWAIFAIASGLKRDEIQPTATWRHGLRVNFNSYCIFIHQNFNQKISFGKGGGDKHQKLHEKNLISSSASLNDVVFFSFLPKKSVEQFPMSQPLTPLYVKKVVNLEISVRQ